VDEPVGPRDPRPGWRRLSFLEIRRLDKSFGDHRVLRELSLELAEGELLALLGLSGSGKTTALRILAGFETADRGEVRVAGQDVTGLSPSRRGFGMVFQHYALFPHMTVAENLAFGLRAQGWKEPRIGERVAEMLALVDLEGFGRRRVSEISGGQQQRVALGRALAPEPRLLLLDEPLSNLDPALRERTRRELKAALGRVGITTVLVTHEQEEAFHLGDRVAVLNAGRLEQVGRPEELYRTPATRFVATFIGRAGVLPGTVEEVRDGEARVAIDEGSDAGSGGSEDGAGWWGDLADPLATGEPAELIAKPESLRLAGDGAPGYLAGRVVERRFTGPLTYARVRLDGGAEVEVLEEGAGGTAEGERVRVAPREGGLRPRLFRPRGPG